MEKQPNRTAAKKIFHVVGLLALALVSVYIIVQCFVIFRRSYKTETAIKYTLAESITLDGVVAFDSVDVAGSGDLGYLVQDGERVTNGTVVAEVYTDDSQGLQRERLDRLERTITLLTKSQNSTGSDLSVLTNQTKQALYNLLDKINTAQYSGITDAEDTFLLAQNRLQVSTGQTAGFADTIAALQVEYDSIKAQLDALQTITATTNGYFSSTAASPAIAADRQALDDADPATLQKMLADGFGQETAQIDLKTYEGIRIDKEALHIVDGQRGVYVKYGNLQRFLKITTLYENDSYILIPENGKIGTDNEVRLYDEIIVQGTNLQDGKLL